MEILQAQFISYTRMFLLDTKFMLDGLLLLSRVIDFSRSSRERMIFHQDFVNAPHRMRENCRNLIYLKVWDEENQTEFDELEYTLTLAPSTRLYAGQTQNFAVRDRNRQGYVTAMNVP